MPTAKLILETTDRNFDDDFKNLKWTRLWHFFTMNTHCVMVHQWFNCSSIVLVNFMFYYYYYYYRATLCVGAVFAVARCPCVCPCVCPSRSYIRSTRVKISSNFFVGPVAPSLVFWPPAPVPNSKRSPLSRGAQYNGVKILRFSTEIAVYSETVRDRPYGCYETLIGSHMRSFEW